MKKPVKSTWVIGSVVAFFVFVGAISGGIGSALIFLALAGVLTAIYGLITGRSTWARLPGSRRLAAGLLIASLAVLAAGSTAYGATHVLASSHQSAGPSASAKSQDPSPPAIEASASPTTSSIPSATPAPVAPAPVAPAPAPVAPAPAPAPVAPAPAPVAPAPAPAPVAPAPATNTVSGTIVPGAFCPNADVGKSGVAANGRTYVCGAKGADANGHYHWNA